MNRYIILKRLVDANERARFDMIGIVPSCGSRFEAENRAHDILSRSEVLDELYIAEVVSRCSLTKVVETELLDDLADPVPFKPEQFEVTL